MTETGMVKLSKSNLKLENLYKSMTLEAKAIGSIA